MDDVAVTLARYNSIDPISRNAGIKDIDVLKQGSECPLTAARCSGLSVDANKHISASLLHLSCIKTDAGTLAAAMKQRNGHIII